MEDIFLRFWHNLLARDSGPLHFRFVLQPLVAAAFAIRSGRRDAREGRPAFFWKVFRGALGRNYVLRQLWRDVGTLFLVALTLDGLYQVIALRWLYPAEALAIAAVLAILPYLVVRGLTNRVLVWLGHGSPEGEKPRLQPGAAPPQTPVTGPLVGPPSDTDTR
jgi:hypothetical protein